jgi:hypothetical protein
MKLNPIDPPRVFEVGQSGIKLKDCAHIRLDPDEQVTFTTESGSEYDVTRKSWGYYATPSLNGRLEHFGLQAALVKGADGKYFLHLIEKGKEKEYEQYMQTENLIVVCWLDGDDALTKLEDRLKG